MFDVEKFIGAVEKRPAIYNCKLKEYSNRDIKRKYWDEIGKEMYEKWDRYSAVEKNELGDLLKRKWKNIRDSYARYLRSVESTTGHISKNVNRYKSWQWARQMEVFRPFLFSSRNDSNAHESNTEHEAIHPEWESDEQPTRESEYFENQSMDPSSNHCQDVSSSAVHIRDNESWNRNKRRRKEEVENYSSVDKVLDYLKRKGCHSSLDATELIFLGYAKTLKTFSPRRQIMTKMKIAQIMMKQELEEQDDRASLMDIKPSSFGSCYSHSTNSDMASPATSTTTRSSIAEYQESLLGENQSHLSSFLHQITDGSLC
ncbi:uncharacterized protein [Centruroides vittatus]|uniref:uncharacterized protein isoform X1 n=1 Tax=Centruroides vittatus TaxID=120091 RepID=UPI00350F12AE